jgi:hypothetical protein
MKNDSPANPKLPAHNDTDLVAAPGGKAWSQRMNLAPATKLNVAI